jgi:isopenicillin N synthase-like dioxygenase
LFEESAVNDDQFFDLDRDPVASSTSLSESVPVLDIGTLGADSTPTDKVVQEIASALKQWGFFQVINHGIPAELITATWHQTRRFFAAPLVDKSKLMRSRENPWGYYNNELTKNQRDKKEVFDYTLAGVDLIYDASNRWLEDSEFRTTMLNYQEACSELSFRLMRAFCVGLNLEPSYLHDEFKGLHTGFTRLNYYPVDDPMAKSQIDHQPVADLGVHHHTDAGVLTVLLQDEVGGLQVHRDGQWHNIKPVKGAFVINTGDMMQVWSNDTYKAAAHRVLAMETKDRYSIPFFFNPPASARVSPLPTVVNAQTPAHYREISWAEFRGKRTDGDYSDYGSEVQISQFRTE